MLQQYRNSFLLLSNYFNRIGGSRYNTLPEEGWFVALSFLSTLLAFNLFLILLIAQRSLGVELLAIGIAPIFIGSAVAFGLLTYFVCVRGAGGGVESDKRGGGRTALLVYCVITVVLIIIAEAVR